MSNLGQMLQFFEGELRLHFRREEEAIYPAMKEFLGEYVDSLVEEHDGAISTALTAAALLSKPSVSPEEAKEAEAVRKR